MSPSTTFFNRRQGHVNTIKTSAEPSLSLAVFGKRITQHLKFSITRSHEKFSSLIFTKAGLL